MSNEPELIKGETEWLERKSAVMLLALIAINLGFFIEILSFMGSGIFFTSVFKWTNNQVEYFLASVIAPLVETPLLYAVVRKFNFINGFMAASVFTIAEAIYHTQFYSLDVVLAKMIVYFVLIRHIAFFLIIVFFNYSEIGLLAAIGSHAGYNFGVTLYLLSPLGSIPEAEGMIIIAAVSIVSGVIGWYAVQKRKAEFRLRRPIELKLEPLKR